eukprot:COSAG01_NODE_1328_length_10708_cov_102.064379_5_plen_70_part_00
MLAWLGGSCGKSSCMALLQRLYEPIAGQILIDDVPIEQYDIHYLRSRIVMVDQHTVRRRPNDERHHIIV